MINCIELTCYGTTPQQIEEMAYREALKFWGQPRDRFTLVVGTAMPEENVTLGDGSISVSLWQAEVRVMIK